MENGAMLNYHAVFGVEEVPAGRWGFGIGVRSVT
jgi:hypothetical protein